jgi:exoribonuclease-2
VARGAQVKLDILRWDEVDLSIEARIWKSRRCGR